MHVFTQRGRKPAKKGWILRPVIFATQDLYCTLITSMGKPVPEKTTCPKYSKVAHTTKFFSNAEQYDCDFSPLRHFLHTHRIGHHMTGLFRRALECKDEDAAGVRVLFLLTRIVRSFPASVESGAPECNEVVGVRPIFSRRN
jgi:hypothetical protein